MEEDVFLHDVEAVLVVTVVIGGIEAILIVLLQE